MDFDFSPKVVELQKRSNFMDEHIYPTRSSKRQIEANRMAQPPILEELKKKARPRGSGPVPPEPSRRRPHQPRVRAALRDHGALGHGAGGVQLRAPDTGNMEVLEHYGAAEHRSMARPALAGRCARRSR
jgi:acyl-CoA dehydrogenase